MDLAMPGVRDFAASTPQRYQGSKIAGFTDEQTRGQEMALGAAGRQDQLGRSAADRSNYILSDEFANPETNKALQGAITASTRPITQALTEQQLPSIRGEGVTTGNFGSTRQGIAEGLASGRASQAIGDTGQKLANAAYDTNINAQLKAMGLLPQTQEAQLAGARTTSGVGDVRQSMEQAKLGEQVANFDWDNMSKYLQSKDILSLLQGLPGGSTLATSTMPQANKMQQAMGGALTGAGAGATFGPVGAGVGALGGAALPFLFS
jgi:hypothetical protein